MSGIPTWEPHVLYDVGTIVVHDGYLYEVVCPEHPDGCPGEGASVRSGVLPPPVCIADATSVYYKAL